MEGPILELRNVSKAFSGQDVLKNVQFSLYENECVAIIGPSGSGKSTIMNLITKIHAPDQGEIRLHDKPISVYTNPKDYAKHVGIIRQRFDLIDSLSVLNNVMAGRLNTWGFWKSVRNLVVPVERPLAEHALQRVGIASKIDEKVSVLSGGEQQRVAIARMIVQNPSLWLADEPVSALDPSRAEDVLRMLTTIAREEKKVLFASMHSVAFVRQFFDRVIAIRSGEILFEKRVDALESHELEALYKIGESDETQA